MNIRNYIIICLLICCSCQQSSQELHLKEGLVRYKKFRYVQQELVADYYFEKVAFFKKNEGVYQFVVQLGDQVPDSLVEKYSLGLHAYMDKQFLPPGKDFLIWDNRPEIEHIGNYKYIIKEVTSPTPLIDSLTYFLYHREGYQNVIGNRVLIKNIKLK